MFQKNLKSFFFVIISLFFSVANAQKTGSVTGKITTSDNTPAEFINVILLEIQKGVITDKNGIYELNYVAPGEYTIQFSLIGLETKEQKITVKENQKVTLNDVVLNEDSATLDEVVINAQRLNQFAQKKTPFVTRLPLKNINTPQSYTVVTNDLITEQINTDLPSSLKSITGGGYIEANTGAVSIYARGFRTDSRVKNGLLQYNRARTVIDNQNIERIEVIKGPSAVTFGSGFYGGLVNLVTKKPLDYDKLDVSYNVGSFGLHRATVDFNKDLGKEYGLRVNAAYHTEDGFQDKGSEIRKHFFVAPTFSFKPSEKFDINLSAEFLSGKRNLNFARAIGRNVTAQTWDALQWDYNNSYTSKDVASTTGYSLFQAEANYKFLPNWTSKTSMSFQLFNANGPYIRLVALSDTQYARQFLGFDPETGGSTNIRQDFVGNYEFSNIKNKTLVGASYYSGFWDYTQVRAQRGFFGIIDRFDLTTNPTIQNITNTMLNSLPSNRVSIESGNNTLSGYISNATTINDMVTILAGIRYDDFTNNATVTNNNKGKDEYEQGKISYNVGLTVNPFDDKVAIFGNYMNGFNNKGPGTNQAGVVQNFDPEEAKQWETGLKLDLFDGKLKSTVSYYNINIDNAILRRVASGLSYLTQDGKIESKGLEVDVIANPFTGFNVVAGYTYNDAKNIKYSNPNAEGKQLDLTPETVANIWASYKVTRGNLKGLGLGFGANHMSKIFSARNVLNTFWAKPYTTLDGTVFYQQKNYRIGVKLNNITNKEYYNAYGMPQKPFNFVVGLTYKM